MNTTELIGLITEEKLYDGSRRYLRLRVSPTHDLWLSSRNADDVDNGSLASFNVGDEVSASGEVSGNTLRVKRCTIIPKRDAKTTSKPTILEW